MNKRILEYSRPNQIRNYKKQVEFIDCKERYTVVEASTKVGKTTGCIVWLFEAALGGKSGQNCWWVAPVFSQTEIAFKRLKRYITAKELFRYNESKMTIECPNGVTIHFKSGDNPDTLYGEDVIAVVIDEGTRVKEEAWYAIRSTLTFTQGRVKIIGNVKGTQNWVYTLAREAEAGNKKDWKYFKITADDAVQAGILKAEEVEDARNTLPNGVFLELYYGIPNQNSSAKFCFAFDEKKHVGKCEVNNKYPVYLSFDFNRNPICAGVIQHYNGTIYVVESIKLANSNIYALCKYIKNKYDKSLFIVTGDASGQASNAMVRDNMNYFTIIRQELYLPSNQLRVPGVNPSIEDNQVLVNAIFEHYAVCIDSQNAQALIFDCKFVEMLADGKINKGDRNNPAQQSDQLDCFVGATLVATEYGDNRIDEIEIGQKVATKNGYKKVIDKWSSLAEVWEFEFSDGGKVQCTKDHKFYSNNIGFYPILNIFMENKTVCKKQSITTDLVTQSIQSKNIITPVTGKTTIQNAFTGKNGLTIMGRFQRICKFTIKMAMHLIMLLKIMNLLKGANTLRYICSNDLKITLNFLLTFKKREYLLLLNGIGVPKGANGIDKMQLELGWGIENMQKEIVNIAERNLYQGIIPENSATIIVNQHIEENYFVKVKSAKCIGVERVYDITVEDEHEFYANGYLVHNCFRYYINTFHKNFIKI